MKPASAVTIASSLVVNRAADWFVHTIRRILWLSTPIVLQNLLQYSMVVVATAFVGHLGDPTIMSATVLAGSLFSVSGYCVLYEGRMVFWPPVALRLG